MIVGLLADACCERFEHFITQVMIISTFIGLKLIIIIILAFLKTNFRFSGALKLEEIVRALSAMFTRFSSSPVRGKFSRLRELMLVLTSDSSTPAAAAAVSENLTHLTASEVDVILALRVDSK
jgi:hypothetical protein